MLATVHCLLLVERERLCPRVSDVGFDREHGASLLAAEVPRASVTPDGRLSGAPDRCQQSADYADLRRLDADAIRPGDLLAIASGRQRSSCSSLWVNEIGLAECVHQAPSMSMRHQAS